MIRLLLAWAGRAKFPATLMIQSGGMAMMAFCTPMATECASSHLTVLVIRSVLQSTRNSSFLL